MLTMPFLQVMGFYCALSNILFPVAAYYLVGKDNRTVGNAQAIGSIASVLLWFGVGRNMV
jgi:hypothetical protein